jgi:hypothetical protein
MPGTGFVRSSKCLSVLVVRSVSLKMQAGLVNLRRNEAHRPAKRQNVRRRFFPAAEGCAETLARRGDDQFRDCAWIGEDGGKGYRGPTKEKQMTSGMWFHVCHRTLAGGFGYCLSLPEHSFGFAAVLGDALVCALQL